MAGAMPSPTTADDLVLVGIVARPHGLQGEVAIDPHTDFADERFAPGAVLVAGRPNRLATLRPETLRVASCRVHQGRPLVRFEGRDTIEAAESLRGTTLWIREVERVPLEPGRFYHSELTGCRVETRSGAVVGDVVRIEETGGSAPLLVVAGRTGEVLVPLAEDICTAIEPAARRIVIEPPEGLLELNAGKS